MEGRGSQFGVDLEACGIQWIGTSSGNSSCGLTRSGLGEGFNGERLAWLSGRGVLALLLMLCLVFLFEFGWLDHCCEDLNFMTTSVRGRNCDKGNG